MRLAPGGSVIHGDEFPPKRGPFRREVRERPSRVARSTNGIVAVPSHGTARAWFYSRYCGSPPDVTGAARGAWDEAPAATRRSIWVEPTGERLGVRVQLSDTLPGWVFRFNGSVGQVPANRVAGKPGAPRNLQLGSLPPPRHHRITMNNSNSITPLNLLPSDQQKKGYT